jgi:hypothetical protein
MSNIDLEFSKEFSGDSQVVPPETRLMKLRRKLNPQNWSRKGKLIVAATTLLFLVIVIPIIFAAIQLTKVRSQANLVITSTQAAYDGIKAQDLIIANEQLVNAKQQLTAMRQTYASLALAKYSPFRWHYLDGERAINAGEAGLEAGQTMIASLEPYADVIGFAGQGSFTGGTAEDRIVKILETLEFITPALDEVTAKIEYASIQIDAIDPGRYPFKIGGRPVAEILTEIKLKLQQANQSLATTRPILEVLPSVAGVGEPKTYLVMFQNDAELRPTGGFMTAYAILDVENGKVTPQKSDDIYELDDKFKLRLKPPRPIELYLPLVYQWNLRDMNLSPDFRESMTTFVSYYQDLPGEADIDGIIALDTQFLKDLIVVLGPVEVPGYGIFSAEPDPRCDGCPQVIYELEDIATRPTPYLRNDRKAVLGPLMQTILQKAYDAPNDVWQPLFQTLWTNITEKHVIFYFFDDTAQNAVELNNFAGRIRPYADGDYLHINNANFGGAKSNMFIEQSVEQEIEFVDGKVRKTLTVLYKNPARPSNCNLEAGQLCLNGILRDWMRVYVPLGSTLVDSRGFEDGTVEVDEDLGYTVLEGFFTVNPLSQSRVQFTYDIPYSPEADYRLLIQKQPGTKLPQHTILLNQQRLEFELATDQELIIPLK